MKQSIFAFTCEQYCSFIFSKLGRGIQHAKIVYQQWFRNGYLPSSHPAFKNGRKLLDEMIALTDFSYPSCQKVNEERATNKYLIVLEDLLEVEMVSLPMKAGWTLCISSQVGCRMGCVFCETGKMGLLRNLNVQEIVSQLFIAIHKLKYPIRNIVFMGMGEPLDNYDALLQAIKIFTDENGFGLGASRITISTSGLAPQINHLAIDAPPSLNLAVSINAASDESRNRLMMINRQYDLHQLKEAMKAYLIHPRRKILIEYVLIEGKNCSEADAKTLSSYLKDLRVTINLIPLNPGRSGVLCPPSNKTVEQFKNILLKDEFRVFVREKKGKKSWLPAGS